MFAIVRVDMKSRTVSLIGYSGSVQHYVDDGKAPPAPGIGMGPGGAGTNVAATPQPVFMQPPNGPGAIPPNVRLPLIRRVELQPAPAIPVAPRAEK
jgi:hypothetical protein